MSTRTHRFDNFSSFTSAYLPVADSSEFLLQVDRALAVTLGEDPEPPPAKFSFKMGRAWEPDDLRGKTEPH